MRCYKLICSTLLFINAISATNIVDKNFLSTKIDGYKTIYNDETKNKDSLIKKEKLSLNSNNKIVTKDNLKENYYNERIENWNGISKGEYRTNSWFVGAFSRYMNVKINKIKRAVGVYSHLYNYFSSPILEANAGKFSISSNTTYIENISNSLSFNCSVDGHVEETLSMKANLDFVSADAKVTTKTGISYAFDTKFTRSATQEVKWSSQFEINENCAKYCPEGYGISIGLVGTYYIFEGEYQEMTSWWWGDFPTQGTEPHNFIATYATPFEYTYTFVYKKIGDSEKDYYCIL